MDRIDETEALGLGGVLAVVGRVAQQPRGHARPESEDNEGEQVAHGHGAAAGLVQGGAGSDVVGVDAAGHGTALAGGGEVVQGDEEEDGAGNVDEGVDAVDPAEHGGTLEEPLLEGQLPEDAEALLEVDDLEGMLAGDINGTLHEGDGSEGAAELVDPVDEGPVPGLDEEGELLEDAAQDTILEDEGVGGRDEAPVAEDLELATAQRGDLVGDQGRCRAGAPAVGRRAALVTGLVAPLVAGIGSPTGPAAPKVIVLVAVEPGTAEEEADDHEGLEECADGHGGGGSECCYWTAGVTTKP